MSNQNSLAPSSAIEVANEFLTLGFEESIDIDKMKFVLSVGLRQCR